MEWNRWNSEEKNPNPNPRHLQENQRIGREISRRPPEDQYRSRNSYHNRDEGYSREQTHYGSRPDSAYRNPDINFGDNRSRNREDYRSRKDYRNEDDYRYQGSYLGRPGNSPRSPYPEDHTAPEQHHDNRYYPERDRYKDTDYRYRSGNRGHWQAPSGGFGSDNEDRSDQRRDYRHQDEGFFDRIGNTIRNSWNTIANYQDEDRDDRDYYDTRNRNFNRGYESGPRWADESENDRYRSRRYYRDEDDRY